MPPIGRLTDEEAEAALMRGGADLKYLMERSKVPKDVMVKWFRVGVTSLERFANIAKHAMDLAEVMKDHLGVDQSATLAERVIVASVTCAWSNARCRS